MAFIEARREAELAALIAEEGRRPDETPAFMETAFRDWAVRASGTEFTRVLPPVSRFAADGGHAEKKQRVLVKLADYVERYFGLGGATE